MGRVIEAFAQFLDGEGEPLVKGWLKFLESGSNNTLKNTYADTIYNIVNANPIQLDAEGRCPNIFGTGDYRVISYTNDMDVLGVEQPGEMIQMFDPVTAQGATTSGSGAASFISWDSTVTYDLDEIVSHSGNYYRSLITSNLNNNPAVSPSSWEQVDFVRWWNASVSYDSGEMVFYDDAAWFSLQASNLNNQPDLSPTYWNRGPTMGGYNLGTAASPLLTGYFTDIKIDNDLDVAGDLNLNGTFQMLDDQYIILGSGGISDDGRIWYDDTGNQLVIKGGSLGIVFRNSFNSDVWEIDFGGRLQPTVDLAENIGQAARRVGSVYSNAYFGNSLMSLGTGTAGWLKIGLHENEVDEDYFHIINMNDNGGIGPFQLQIYYNGSAYTLESV